LSGESHAYQFTAIRNRNSKILRDLLMLLEMSKYDDSLGFQVTAGAAVTTDAFHVIFLLRECRDYASADLHFLRDSEDLVDPFLARFQLHDCIHLRTRQMQKNVWRQRCVPEYPADVGSAGRGDGSFCIPVPTFCEYRFVDPNQAQMPFRILVIRRNKNT
jgi:hypothetical protein